MTVNEARELLGDEVKDLTDAEVEDLIRRTSEMCDAILDVIVEDSYS